METDPVSTPEEDFGPLRDFNPETVVDPQVETTTGPGPATRAREADPKVKIPQGLAKRKKDIVKVINGTAAVDMDKVISIEDEVLALRVRGVAFRDIEKRLNITHSYRIYKRALDRSPSEQLRRDALILEGERLDQLQDNLWDRALIGDARAVEVVLKVLERRAKVFGLDFADLLGARHAEVEEAKVKLMAIALTRALDKAELDPEIRKVVLGEFIQEIRAVEEKPEAESDVA